ncbi:DUF6338 family protein [Stutzerimonas nitrititolerans]|uniref:DUF6338 family protein n=1 Tax=Stutzerimonas nitrititolerans TaxID=2482751 RepID=UPI0028A8DA2E|nr:DUF6338 family protein [Stutzerimonas nitrititolerans]
MDGLVTEIIPLLQYLIPGFVTAWIFYCFTSFKRPDTFGQIVQALIFTFLTHNIVLLIKSMLLWVGAHGSSFGPWSATVHSAWSAAVAVFLGFLASWLANNDRLHSRLRDIRLTSKTSHPNEWFSAFSKHKRFVVLHLEDERRLYGWPSEWPSEPSQGQFVMEQPSWLADDGSEIPMPADFLVIAATKVQWVEFTTKTWG